MTISPITYPSWGADIEQGAHTQMEQALSLPVSIKGALMPDAHVGYGLPIGGVLATKDAVIPYAVGVDIACRVMISFVDFPVNRFDAYKSRCGEAIEKGTLFGTGKGYGKKAHSHEVLDDLRWRDSPLLVRLRDTAHDQLGTSGSGNHFVEFGLIKLTNDISNISAGTYLALVSHSGSRGAGAQIAAHFTRLAKEHCRKELSGALLNLAWLSLKSSEGQEYWRAMELMGSYASANHHLIHRSVLSHFGYSALGHIENHHNYAWKETIDGDDLVVHRKGATPAGKNVLGYIPGSMTAPGFLVRGKGKKESLHSAAHGAGRRLSRKAALQSTTKKALRDTVQSSGVTLLSAGLDESPHAYKDIYSVMAAQEDLVEIIGTFTPKVVKMAPEGERAED
jgi:tRNA-splicing ligase RtcB (3'-phosphate/5'-hydroxy nucleic acid ligase)